MEDLFSSIEKWIDDQKRIALATVVKTWGSSPRGIGAKMVVNELGEMSGSVSGGCVEAAVVQECMDIIRTGGTKLLHYGVNDERAWEVGLACGGEIEIFIRELDVQDYEKIKEGWKQRVNTMVVSVLRGGTEIAGREIVLWEEEAKEKFAHSHFPALQDAITKSLNTKASIRKTDCTENFDIFIDFILPQPTLIVVGGVHIAIPLVEIANTVGFFTVLIDPRRKFANKDRFPNVNQIINAWPKTALSDFDLDGNTAVAVLTHDPKIDDPALESVLVSQVFYIGALGSRKTQMQRRNRLIEAGYLSEQVDRIYGPIGLDLGSRSPGEIALGIMAEIVMVRNRKREDS